MQSKIYSFDNCPLLCLLFNSFGSKFQRWTKVFWRRQTEMPYKCSVLTLFCSEICSNSFVKIIFNEYSTDYVFLMSQSIPTVYTPGKIVLSERILVTRVIFCLIPCSGAKNYGRIPGGGAKVSQTRRNSPLNLQKVLKKFRKLRDRTFFCLENLTKLLF